MIAAIPLLWRWLGGALIVVLVLGGIYLKGRSDGKAVVQAELDAQRATWQGQFDRQAAETARIEEARDQLKWRIERELEPRLAAATDRGATLAERLRQHTSRRVCALSEAAGGPALPDGASGIAADSGGVDEAVEQHFAACSRDAERLTTFQEFYRGLLDRQPAPP